MIVVSPSPHIHSGKSSDFLMWQVVLALMPVLAAAVWNFGIPAAFIVGVCLLSCLVTEWVIDKLTGRANTLRDGSAVITALLLAFNLPSILPWWMAVIGSVVAIGIGKMSFGGLGCNIWNPALVGRVFLLISFPAAMTTWPVDIPSGIDGMTGATVLSYMNSAPDAVSHVNMLDMAVGKMNGSLGETGAVAILIGAVYLLIRGVITWHIPVSVLLSAAIFSWLFGGNPLVDLLAGGLMLGACFMATDYVTSPMTRLGQVIFGACIGLITIIIRRYGAYPEGVSFAILLMNSFVPLINRYTRPVVFGQRERRSMDKVTGKGVRS
ncbi:MAG: RnfABCDGE type electron transport complex subunit D [Muribaculaceae bacterium]|nr:RnfABCDGE type electron transport complex subunit D [Muribaculaceae bacterium]